MQLDSVLAAAVLQWAVHRGAPWQGLPHTGTPRTYRWRCLADAADAAAVRCPVADAAAAGVAGRLLGCKCAADAQAHEGAHPHMTIVRAAHAMSLACMGISSTGNMRSATLQARGTGRHPAHMLACCRAPLLCSFGRCATLGYKQTVACCCSAAALLPPPQPGRTCRAPSSAAIHNSAAL